MPTRPVCGPRAPFAALSRGEWEALAHLSAPACEPSQPAPSRASSRNGAVSGSTSPRGRLQEWREASSALEPALKVEILASQPLL